MKKIYLAIIFMFLTLLIACVPPVPPGPGPDPDPDPDPEQVTITYAAWNLGLAEDNNIERRLIAEFEATHPKIKVEVINRPVVVDEEGNESETTWLDFFGARAATGNLPDVYQVADLATWIRQGWTEDVSDLAALDSDLALVPQDIVDAARYGDYLFSLPQARFYYGFYIDRTVISETSRSPIYPEYGISYADLMAAAKANSKFAAVGGDGVAGIDGMNSLIEWLPAQIDPTLGWWTYNEEGYHLNGTAFAQAVAEQKKYQTYVTGGTNANYFVLEAQTQEIRELNYGVGDPWTNGKQSIKFGPSYNLRDIIKYTLTADHPMYGHDIDFIGTPSYEGNQRIPTILDFISVGKGTKHRAEAYLFAKWMGYGIDGYRTRLEIATEFPEAGAINFPPIVQDEALIDEYFALYPTMTEYRKLVEQHTDFITESIGKTVPGYWSSRGSGAYDESNSISAMVNKIIQSEVQLADVASNLNIAANRYWTEAKALLDAYLASLSS